MAAIPHFLPLLGYVATLNLLLNLATVVLTPLLLSYADPTTLSRVLATALAGTVAGGLVIGARGGPSDRVAAVVRAGYALSACLIVAGLRRSTALLALGLFGALFAAPFINASLRAIWQERVRGEQQGRAAAALQLPVRATVPAAMLAAGPLTDHVFEPLLLPGGPLTPVAGAVLGVGPGRGTGLFFMSLGVVGALSTLVLARWARRRGGEFRLEAVTGAVVSPGAPGLSLVADRPSRT